MSFIRIFIFTCDTCHKEESIENFGGPPGFKYYNTKNDGIKHACPKCSENLLITNKAKLSKTDNKQLIVITN